MHRPVAEVLFRGTGGRAIREYLYVDSGADHTLIPLRLGRTLGLSAGEEREVRGIAGMAKVVYAELEIELAGLTFRAPVAWAQTDDVPVLLGRAGVFDRFDITFAQARRVVLFRPAGEGRA